MSGRVAMSTGERIRVVGGVMLAALAGLLLYLFVLMVVQHDKWTRRSQDNRWAFRAVPSMRGALLDRTGRPLAWDEPSTELALYYGRFRSYHAVGAAVHAATLAARLAGDDLVSYSYEDGPVGPMVALRDVLALPTRLLRPNFLEKNVAKELATTVTTVLSVCSGRSRTRSYTAIRGAYQRGGTTSFGDVFDDVSRADLEAAFRAALGELQQLEIDIQALGAASAPPGCRFASLFEALEEQRRAALGLSVVGEETEHQAEIRLKRQTILQVFAQQVPFELAASVRLGASRHPGIVVQPSVRRVTDVPPDSSLEAWLGRVVDLDRSSENGTKALLDEVAPEDPAVGWKDAIVPTQFADGEVDRDAFAKDAAGIYRSAMMSRERRGVSGIEATLDRDLRGQLGLRFVERDKLRREQRMFGHLQVESGADVRLSIDASLQAVVESNLWHHYQSMRARHEDPAAQDRVAAAMVMIDARSGDILAYASLQNELHIYKEPRDPDDPKSPLDTRREWKFGRLPGVAYPGNSALGSVVKPFVLVEHLRAEALGLPHIASAEMLPCEGKMKFGDRRLGCLGHHGEAGRDGAQAIAESCNTFFFQAARGLEEAGFARALQRFALLRDENGPFEATWMASVPSLPPGIYNRPQLDDRQSLPLRGIGYGVYALPVDVARAYAALATGYLPTLGVVHGEGRAIVPLGDLDAELRVVREGMKGCVQRGTAKDVPFPPGIDIFGKTGTAEVSEQHDNNAWFAGFLGHVGHDGVQIAFAAVVYRVAHRTHGADVAGQIIADVLNEMQLDPRLAERYLVPEGR
ncbi:MAG: hypothetical protein KDC48_07490 [Planctomycetes bacterium]|nr:hypothetical protein [Planctomycetota bacterium]